MNKIRALGSLLGLLIAIGFRESTTGLVDTKQPKRRQYSEALKRHMVAETQAPSAYAAAVCWRTTAVIGRAGPLPIDDERRLYPLQMND